MESTSEGGDGGMMFVRHKKEGSLGGQLPEEGTFFPVRRRKFPRRPGRQLYQQFLRAVRRFGVEFG